MADKEREPRSPQTLLGAAVILSAFPFLLIQSFPARLNVVIEPAAYLVFHNLAEFFSIMVCWSIFGVGWFAFGQSGDRRALFLSTAFLAIGLLDFLHAMSNAAMPAFITPNSSNKSTQFWIAARLLQSIAFLASAFVYPAPGGGRFLKATYLAPALLVVGLAFFGIVFHPALVPDTFVAGVGLTPFKRNAEYLVILLTLAAAAAYWRRMSRTGDRLLLQFIAAFVISVFGEIAFAVYTRVFDTYNALGHVYKVASFSLLYAGLFASSVRKPYDELAGANEEIRRFNADLERRVEERTAQLARSEERYRNLFGSMTEGFGLHEIILDAAGKPCDYRYLEVNRAFERLTGLSRGEILGRTARELFPKSEPSWVETYGKVALTGEAAHFQGFSAPLARWYDTYAYSPARGQFAVLFWDVTEHKRVEQEREALLAKLESAVGELEGFTLSVSHDLRAPIRHVCGFAELLKRHAWETLDEQGRMFVTTIAAAAGRLETMTGELLKFSRLGRVDLHKSPVDLGAVLASVRQELGDEAHPRDVEWVVGRLPTVPGDRSLLHLVVGNLLSNALKFTRTRERARIEVGCTEDRREYVVCVRDNGVGFDMGYKEKLFGVFQRLHPEQQFEGTGVGLASVRRIVERHGGRVWAESAPGEGAAFFFSLPKCGEEGG